MPQVTVTTRIAAPLERVWQALVDPLEVERWDGARPVAVPDGYPAPGQHARWRTRVGPFTVTLHDRVRAVEDGRRLAARITYGIVDLDEEYRLVDYGHGGTVLMSDNAVRGRLPGLAPLAGRTARRAVEGALARLKAHCESVPP